jgi:hypothetical protein
MGRLAPATFFWILALSISVCGCSMKLDTSPARVKQAFERIYVAIDQYTTTTNRPIKSQVAQKELMHSWRVAIYPWMSSNEFYGRYDFEKPYDDPSNLLASSLVRLGHQSIGSNFDPGSLFRTQADIEARKNGWTAFLLVTTDDNPEVDLRTKVPDGNEATILLVYVPLSRVEWTKPEDLVIRKDGMDNALLEEWLRMRDKFALFRDGKTRQIATNASREELLSMCTPDGGEPIALDRHKVIE